MPDIGFVTAFLGGVIALMSPCSALLLPAFFASTVGNRLSLLGHALVFYTGLLLTLLPVGLGIGALGALFAREHGLIIALTSVLLIVFGIVQLARGGFDLSRAVPGMTRLQGAAANTTGVLKTLLLGAAGGIAGFCTGPILGSILSIGFSRGNTVAAAALLAVYALGMVVPLTVLAAVWNRLSQHTKRRLRGGSVTVFGRPIHITQLLTGALLIAVGILFWTTNGLVSAPSLVPVSALSWLQQRGEVLSHPAVEITAIVLLAAIALWLWWRWQRRTQQAAQHPAEPPRQSRPQDPPPPRDS